MGTSAGFLVNANKYDFKKFLSDIFISSLMCDLMLSSYNDKYFSENGDLSHVRIYISDKYVNENDRKCFMIFVDTNHYVTEFYNYEELNIDQSLNLSRVALIENVIENHEIIFRFAHHYLRLNPDDFFWVTDNDWVYTLDDMNTLSKKPYNSNWYFTNPKK